MERQTSYRKPPSQQPAYSPHVGDRAGTGTELPSPWAPHSTAVNVTLAGHLWEALKFFKNSFDEDKNGGLVAGGGRRATNQRRQGDRAQAGEWRELRALQGLRERSARAQMGATASVVHLPAFLFSRENCRAEQAQSRPDTPKSSSQPILPDTS